MFGRKKNKGLAPLIGYTLKRSMPVQCDRCTQESERCVKVHFAGEDCVCVEKV